MLLSNGKGTSDGQDIVEDVIMARHGMATNERFSGRRCPEFLLASFFVSTRQLRECDLSYVDWAVITERPI